MKRSIPMYALLFASVSAILGSGWLFAAFYTAALAGPAALLSWCLGGLMVILIAFVFAELSALIPITGFSTRIPQYTHGTLVSFVFAWMIWLSYAAITPTEVQAVLQYLSYFVPAFTHADTSLTHLGYAAAVILMLLVSAINVYSLRWLMRFNSALTVLKIVIPTIVALIILKNYFSWTHLFHPAQSSFMPNGWHGVLGALTTGGIVFAFNGFKQACEMGGEAKNPHRALPFAVIGSVLICLVVYLLLQIAFLTSVNASNLMHGWGHIQLTNQEGPLAAIVVEDRLSYLIPLLYIGAIVGPLAAALMYANSSARSLYGMSKNKQIPAVFEIVSHDGNPMVAIWVNFIFGLFMFAPLPGWDAMVSFLTSIMAITYTVGPITLLALRSQLARRHRPFKLPFAWIWASFAFYLCTLLTYWSGWQVISKLSMASVLGLVVLFIHRVWLKPRQREPLHWQSSIWLWFYFIGITVFSYLGNFGGGRGWLTFGWDFVALGIFSAATIWLAMQFKLPAEMTQIYIETLELPTQT